MADFPRRGQIYWVDLSPTKGSEQSGRRPAVIVSNDITNQHGSVVVIVPMTSKTKHKRLSVNVHLPANNPLPQEGLVLCNQIRTVAQERLDGYRADLSPSQLREVERAIALVLGLPKPPRLN